MENSEAVVDRMLVAVFDDESRAYQAKNALIDLELDHAIGVYASSILVKNSDGTVTVKESSDSQSVGPMVGTVLGSLIGLLAGPAGVAMGVGVGLLGGTAAEMNNARINSNFIDDVGRQPQQNKIALVAEIQESSPIPVDGRMKAIGGTVFRRDLSEITDVVDSESLARFKAELARMEAQLALVHADQKAKLQESIERLRSEIKGHTDKIKERRQMLERRAKAKVAGMESEFL